MVPASSLTFSRQCPRSLSTSSSSSRTLLPILIRAAQLFAHDKAMLEDGPTHSPHHQGHQLDTSSRSSSHSLHHARSPPSQQQHASTWISFTAQPQLVSDSSSNIPQSPRTRRSDFTPPSQKRRRTSPATAWHNPAYYMAQPWAMGHLQPSFSPPVENWPLSGTIESFKPRVRHPRGRPTTLQTSRRVPLAGGQTQRSMHVEAVPDFGPNDLLAHRRPRNQDDENSVQLPTGETLTSSAARGYIDFYCKAYKLPQHQVLLKLHNRQDRMEQWKAEMSIADVLMGIAFGPSKEAAEEKCYFNAVLFIDAADHVVWTQYMASLVSSHSSSNDTKDVWIQFNTSSAVEDKASNLLQHMENSSLCSRPPTANAQSDSSEFSTRRQLSFAIPSRGQLAAKSKLLLSRQEEYQKSKQLTAMRAARESLPVSQNIKEVLAKLAKHQILICMAATGSGKSTQVPQMILDEAIRAGEGATCNILCTQPRRIAAISLAQRVAEERGEKVGDSVGYQVRFDKKLPQPNGTVTYLTTGVLIARLKDTIQHESQGSTTWLDTITHIVLDEVHERGVETDLLLAVLRKVIERRRTAKKRDIKIILMSATVDPKLFQDYFLGVSGKAVPVVNIPGRAFPVQKHFMEDTVAHLKALNIPDADGGWVWRDNNVIEYVNRELSLGAGLHQDESEARGTDDLDIPYPLVALYIAHALNRGQNGHVLVFLPGLEETKSMHRILAGQEATQMLGLNFRDAAQFEIHILHSSVPVADQQAVFRRAPKGVRRIILSTNIAETSVTIPDVTAVIDTGKVKEMRHDPNVRLSSLVSAWVGKSNISQRAGRAGRHRPGEYFGLLSTARHDRLSVSQTVEILLQDLTDIVLQLKAFAVHEMDAEEVLAATIEPPAPERVQAAIQQLRLLGALDASNNLTPLGKLMGQIPLSAAQGRMIIYGLLFQCFEPAVLLAAILAVRDPFQGPIMLRQQVNEARRSFAPPHYKSDLMATFNAFYAWEDVDKAGSSAESLEFCDKNFLSLRTLRDIRLLARNIKTKLRPIVRSLPVVNGQSHSQQETYAGLNENATCTPLLACLIAISSTPNFAVREGNLYRTGRDARLSGLPNNSAARRSEDKKKSSSKHPQDVLCYEEKTTSVSVSSDDRSLQMLRRATRLDCLSYVLFGAHSMRAQETNDGEKQGVLICDEWLTVEGPEPWLDVVQRLRSVLDKSMSRVFEGINERQIASEKKVSEEKKKEPARPRNKRKKGDGAHSTQPSLELDQQETKEFKELIDGLAVILKEHSVHCYEQGTPDDTFPDSVSEQGSREEAEQASE